MPAPERLEVRKMMNNVKNRVTNETTAIGQIYTDELVRSNLSTTALALAPTAKLANPSLHQIRRQTTPNLPTSMNFDIPTDYKRTMNNERYLLTDRIQRVDGNIGKRLLFFATDEQLRVLFTSDHIMMDGTFDTCPAHFDQIYSIHSVKNNQSVVCVIAILCGRSSIIYKELLAILCQHARRMKLRFHPARITTDFEHALIKTLGDEYPNVNHTGCYYHFTNALYRQIQHLGLTAAYRDDEHIRLCTRKLMVLPFVPVNYIQEAFDEVSRQAPDLMEPFVNYFERFWMRKMKWSLWNVSGVELRTNNWVEGWNHRFNRISAHVPTEQSHSDRCTSSQLNVTISRNIDEENISEADEDDFTQPSATVEDHIYQSSTTTRQALAPLTNSSIIIQNKVAPVSHVEDSFLNLNSKELHQIHASQTRGGALALELR
ncbi:unnamed protein product [Adineta steineri]|uniref:MULE transposase domain-containing protein n=1 Tax=Adineta steineri TaxID=433720 RepID=A0A815D781_9BILA|nr:unnamed protein product [Adineta steineri]CAF4094889.1 unnamed protein product [Adineta steineri]